MLIKSKVQWQPVVDGLKGAVQFIDTREALQFIEGYFMKIINLITQQR